MAFSETTSDRLLNAANDGAKSLRALFFWYVGALTYAVISVASVSDEQLLRKTALKLPILGVDIPLVEYFSFLPLLVVLIHIELLVQFALLSNKTNDFHKSLSGAHREMAEDYRLRLENFMLAHLLAGDHYPVLRCLLFLLLYGSLIVFPLFALLLIQVQFLAYHSETMMWWHRLLILIDAAALLYLWPNLFHRKDLRLATWARLMVFRVLPRAILLIVALFAIYLAGSVYGAGLVSIMIAQALLIVLVIVAVVATAQISPVSATLSKRPPEHVRRSGVFVTLAATAVAVVLAFGVALAIIYRLSAEYRSPLLVCFVLTGLTFLAVIIPVRGAGGGARSRLRELAFRICRHQTRARYRDVPGMTAFAAQCITAVAVSWLVLVLPKPGEPRLDTNGICIRDEEHQQSFVGLLLHPIINDIKQQGEERSCEQIDWHTELQGEYAAGQVPVTAFVLKALGKRRVLNLSESVLASHELTPALRESLRNERPDVSIEPIDLRNRDLRGIQLMSAVLPRARFDGAQMRGASLIRAHMAGSVANGTDMTGAILRNAVARDAEFSRASLVDADMNGIEIQSGTLSNTKLLRVDLSLATASGASFAEAELQGSRLTGVSASLSSFRGANLDGALFGPEHLSLLSRREADLRASLLSFESARGALFDGPNLKGADLANARLDYAVIIDPKVGLAESEIISLVDELHDPEEAAQSERLKKEVRSKPTRWPSREMHCLLILKSVSEEEKLLPNCRFFLNLGEGGSKRQKRAKKKDIIPDGEFWRALGTSAAQANCNADIASDIRLPSALPTLPLLLALASLTSDQSKVDLLEAASKHVSDAAIDELTSTRCKGRLSFEQVLAFSRKPSEHVSDHGARITLLFGLFGRPLYAQDRAFQAFIGRWLLKLVVLEASEE